MSKITRYIHIGYPKNLSTTLQRDFFDPHPQLLHLGIGNGSNVDYIDPDICKAMENYIIYAKDYSYEDQRAIIKNSFDKWFTISEGDQSYRAVGISLELLSFSSTPDHVDVTTKAKRLHDNFGADTKIIMIIRKQFELLKSLYRECIRLGYFGTYQDFISYVYIMKDRNFCYDFQYDKTYSLYAGLFGAENILVLPIEKARDLNGYLITQSDKIVILEQISEFLGCDYINSELQHYNDPLSDEELIAKRGLNKKYPHDIGNTIYSQGVNFHRLKNFLLNDLELHLNEEFIFQNVIDKQHTIKLAKTNPSVGQKIDYSINENILSLLKTMFIKSNKKLAMITGLDLPEQYFDLGRG